MEESTNKPDVEKFVRFSAVVDDLQGAWVFVMEHLEEVGSRPSIEIRAVVEVDWVFSIGDDDDDEEEGDDGEERYCYSVSVSGVTS